MTKKIELHLPDELAEAIEDEYDRRAEELSRSMDEHGWNRQAELVGSHLDERAGDSTAIKALALLASEADDFDTERV